MAPPPGSARGDSHRATVDAHSAEVEQRRGAAAEGGSGKEEGGVIEASGGVEGYQKVEGPRIKASVFFERVGRAV